MSDTTYSVVIPLLQEIKNELISITGQIQTTTEHLDDQSAMHLAAWTSTARDAYDLNKAQWDASARDMQNKLPPATAALQQIIDAYTHGELAGTNLWER